MNPEDLKKMLDALSAADVREFTLKTGEFDLSLRRGPQAMTGAPTGPAPLAPVQTAAASSPAQSAAGQPLSAPSAPPVSPAPEAAPSVPQAAPTPAKPSGTPLKAPIVGTFYLSSSPDAPAFVKVGDRVEAGQVLCIIEAMKLMNEIEAEAAGTVREILVKNAEPVEYGQTLFYIE